MDDLTLATRAGLPDALRVLLERHPRASWEAHPEFNALTRFWLDRHLMFREAQARLIADTQGFLDHNRDPQRFASGLSRLAGFFVNELHGHHHIEDAHYFPALAAQDARVAPAFALLDRDHQALDGGLHALAERTNAVLAAVTGTAPAAAESGALLAELEGFQRLLDRHLTDEEEIVVPVILEYRGAGLG